MAQAAVAEIPRLIEELRAQIIRKTGKPIDPDVDFLTTQIEILSMSGPVVTPREIPADTFSATEWALFNHLARRPGMTFTREAILNALYCGADEAPEPKILDVFVCRMRKKLKQLNAPCWIESVYGIGLRLVNTPAANGKLHNTHSRRPHSRNCGFHLHQSLDECTCHKAAEIV